MNPAGGFFAAWLGVAVGATWKASLLVLLAAGVALVLRRGSAAGRHLLWAVALGGTLAVPLLSFGPRLPVSVPGWPAVPQPAAIAPTGQAVETAPRRIDATPVAARDQGAAAEPTVPMAAVLEDRAPAAGDVQAARVAPEPAAPVATSDAAAPAAGWSWPALLFLVWLAGVALTLAAIAASVVRVWLVGRRARPLGDVRVRQRLDVLARELGVRGVRLLEARGAVMPVTWGLRRATILLPAQASEWHPALLDAVLLHELAHVQRRDLLAQVTGELAAALYWYNPLVWWALARMREESELACDDIGARGLSGRPEYAHELVELARALRSQRRLSVAAIALARRAQLTGRVMALLDETRSHLAASPRQRWATVALATAVALPLAVVSPRAAQSPGESAADAVELALPLDALAESALEVPPAPAALVEATTNPSGPVAAAAAPTEAVEVREAKPSLSLTALRAAVVERHEPAIDVEADLRARPLSAAAVAVGLAVSPPAANGQAQQQQPTRYTIYGTVTDSLTGRPIADAAVGFKPGYKAVLTDSLGHFLMKGLKSARQTVVVQQLGYEDRKLTFLATEPVARLDMKLNPDPIVLKGLTVVVRDYRRMLKRMSVGRVYERRDLIGMNLTQLGSILRGMGAIQPVSPGDAYAHAAAQSCPSGQMVWVRGQRECLTIRFDDQGIYWGGFSGVPGYPAGEIYAIIVGPGGRSVTVISNWYIEYLARNGRRLSMY